MTVNDEKIIMNIIGEMYVYLFGLIDLVSPKEMMGQLTMTVKTSGTFIFYSPK